MIFSQNIPDFIRGDFQSSFLRELTKIHSFYHTTFLPHLMLKKVLHNCLAFSNQEMTKINWRGRHIYESVDDRSLLI